MRLSDCLPGLTDLFYLALPSCCLTKCALLSAGINWTVNTYKYELCCALCVFGEVDNDLREAAHRHLVKLIPVKTDDIDSKVIHCYFIPRPSCVSVVWELVYCAEYHSIVSLQGVRVVSQSTIRCCHSLLDPIFWGHYSNRTAQPFLDITNRSLSNH